MNRFAYLTTGWAVKALSGMSKARIRIHGAENIPAGAVIYAVNHFTRMETLILPSYIYELTDGTPVWSLADYTLFKGGLKNYLEKVGAVSTRAPDRDLLMVRTLLTGEASWIIFPEGRMVKSKKVFDKGRFMIASEKGKHPPHTGVATLALRTEFYRQRLGETARSFPEEAERLAKLFQISSIAEILKKNTCIVPVNITYYPMRARENILSRLAVSYVENISDRAVEEIMTEGTMLLSGVDVDIRFGPPIYTRKFLEHPAVRKDICSGREIGFDDRLSSEKHLRKAARKIMHRYMTSIYRMTTVNHDHLFASLLKYMPFRKCDPDDLCRRVFLIGCGIEESGVFLHDSLHSDQLSLLTDDSYHKFKDFMEVALDKGVLGEENGVLKKQKKSFSSVFDFHQIRIGNPLTVMANETEPLDILQKKIRRTARAPACLIRQKTFRFLLQRAMTEFDNDYEAFFAEGESRTKEVGRPFLMKGKKRDTGLMLIHGYMAAPLEMADLAVYLGKERYSIFVPRLRGHGTSPEDLAGRTYKDWIASADAGYALLRTLCRRIIIIGFSTGAAIALELASRIRKVEAVVAVCPPRRLHDLYLKKSLAKDIWKRLLEKVRKERTEEKEFIENTPEHPHISYHRNPVEGIREIELFMDELEPQLPRISVPALVLHSVRDPVSDPEGSKRIYEMLGSVQKEYVLFNFDRHNILSGQGSQRVHQLIGAFIRSFSS
ncbi:MAG: alpha/beta fold hydrolase [Desulfococcaceae bacterium]|nr:alpha/beta fold hydrolase [Desulfococcaceae bacterium]